MKKFRFILIPLLLLALAFNTAVVFAGDDDEGIEPYILTSASIAFNRINLSQSLAEVNLNVTGTIEYIKTTITLQEADPDTGVYSDVPGSTITKTAYSSPYYHARVYNTSSSKKYRIKVKISTKCTESSNSSTKYKVLSE